MCIYIYKYTYICCCIYVSHMNLFNVIHFVYIYIYLYIYKYESNISLCRSLVQSTPLKKKHPQIGHLNRNNGDPTVGPLQESLVPRSTCTFQYWPPLEQVPNLRSPERWAKALSELQMEFFDPHKWMSRWKLGSMVSKWVITPRNTPFINVVPNFWYVLNIPVENRFQVGLNAINGINWGPTLPTEKNKPFSPLDGLDASGLKILFGMG